MMNKEVLEVNANRRKKFFSILSLCKRAGQLVSGESNCENAIRGKHAKMIFLSSEASANTRKKFINSSIFYKVQLYVLDLSKEQMGVAIGEAQRSVITITGENFIKQLKINVSSVEYNGGGPIA